MIPLRRENAHQIHILNYAAIKKKCFYCAKLYLLWVDFIEGACDCSRDKITYNIYLDLIATNDDISCININWCNCAFVTFNDRFCRRERNERSKYRLISGGLYSNWIYDAVLIRRNYICVTMRYANAFAISVASVECNAIAAPSRWLYGRTFPFAGYHARSVCLPVNQE